MATILVTIRQSEGGGSYEFTPEPEEAIRWKVDDNGTLFFRKAVVSEEEPHPQFEVFRVFAHGVWADVEQLD